MKTLDKTLLLLCSGLMILMIMVGAWAQDKRAAPVNLTTLDWRYQFGDGADRAQPGFDASNWPGVMLPGELPETMPPGMDGFVWYRAEIPSAMIGRFDNPMLFLGRIQDADQTYLNGRLLGETGRFIRSARDFAGSASSQASRAYAMGGADETDRETYTLAIRVQSINFAPGLLDGPLLVGEAGVLTTLADETDIWVWIRDCLMLAVLAVGAVTSAIVVHGRDGDKRQKWLPWFLGTLFLASIPYTLPGYHVGLATPGLVWAGEMLSYILFGTLHFRSIMNLPADPVFYAVQVSYYGVMAAIWLLDPGLEDFVIWASVALMIPGLYGCFLLIRLWQAFRARLMISRWNYLAVGIGVAMIVIYLSLKPVLLAELDPWSIGIIAMTLCLLMSLGDHHRFDRRSLAEVTGKLLVAQDAERERIAKDLHDDLNQRIAATRLRLEALSSRNGDISRQDIERSIHELKETGMAVSAMVEGLAPATLDPVSFGDGLRQMLDRWQGVTGSELSLHLTGDCHLASETQIQAMRICQEALHNAIRHSDASLITVEAQLGDTSNLVVIGDDGIGFNPDDVSRGIGLGSMHERAKLMGAKLTITSAPDAGCTVRLEFRNH